MLILFHVKMDPIAVLTP